MSRNLLAYMFTILVFAAGIYALLQSGKRLESARAHPVAAVQGTEPIVDAGVVSGEKAGGGLARVVRALRENLHDSLSLLLVQLILIVLLARVFGVLFARLGQPAVIGEMIAGIVLGPSLVGAFFPGAFAFIFPAASLGALRMLSQVGVILFLFVVGMDVDAKHLRSKADTALIVSHVSIVFPYFLGVLFAFLMFRSLAPPNASFPAFALFIGIAMSITAFPVLARIIEERGLANSQLGRMAITCAAIDDITAWSILAFVVAVVKAGRGGNLHNHPASGAGVRRHHVVCGQAVAEPSGFRAAQMAGGFGQRKIGGRFGAGVFLRAFHRGYWNSFTFWRVRGRNRHAGQSGVSLTVERPSGEF